MSEPKKYAVADSDIAIVGVDPEILVDPSLPWRGTRSSAPGP